MLFHPHTWHTIPHPLTIRKWDELTTSGIRVVAIGGSDAHALSARLGPLHAIIYPYPFHFQSINTHLLVANPLSGDLLTDPPDGMECAAGWTCVYRV